MTKKTSKTAKTAKAAAPSVNAPKTPLPSIAIVMVGSESGAYLKTLAALFKQAKHPERLQALVCLVADPVRSKAAFDVPEAIAPHVTLVPHLPQYYRGHHWALSEAFKHAKGDFTLVLADQATVQKHWDEALLAAAQQAGDPAVITHFPASAKDAVSTAAQGGVRLTLQSVDFSAPMEMFALRMQAADAKETLQPVPLANVALLFAASHVFAHVPFDPYLALAGDYAVYDVSFAARLWTHGIGILQLTQSPLVAHLRLLPELEAFQLNAPHRIRHVLGLTYSDEEKVVHELDLYAHGDARDTESFWEFAGVNVDRRTLKPHAKQGHFDTQHLAEGEDGSEYAQATIFVQIASYRDPECQHTVRDLFQKATYPDRITVGICWQSIPEEDQDCFQIVTRPAQVRVKHFDARQSRGACWARHHVQQLWQGEQYTLQIDSHMRFEQGWDVDMLEMLAACPSENAVLSTYPPGYEPPNTIQQRDVLLIVAKEFDQHHIFLMQSLPIQDEARLAKPILGAFMGACFLFGPSSIIRDVPYDPYLYFFGEEITLSVRLWTHGYDIYAPNRVVIYHDWKRERRKNTHFSDHDWGKLNDPSFARVRYLLGTEEPSDPATRAYVMQELDIYGLGTARSLADYEAYAGVSFANRAITPEAYQGIFAPAAQAGVPMAPRVMVRKRTLGGYKPTRAYAGPIKTLEMPEALVFDDFLPEDEYELVYKHAIQSDYRHINTSGQVVRVWNVDNGFPLRSMWDHHYRTNTVKHPDDHHTFPTHTPNDLLFNAINHMMPQVQHLVGKPAEEWSHASMTSWLYPPNTGLSLHNDGNSIYTGAYIYYLNREWRIHWGGLLMVLDRAANQAIETHRTRLNEQDFYRNKWLNESEHDDYAAEVGFARCIFPKRNRIVFIAPDAYHIVTKVLASAGDNVRMSLAGFFNRKKEGNQPEMKYESF